MKQLISKLYKAVIPKLLTLLGFGSTLTFMACYAPAPDDYRIVVFPSHLDFGYDDNQAESVTIQTDGKWFVSEVTPFISVTPVSGNYHTTMTVRMAEENESSSIRQGIIVVQSFDDPQYSDTVYVYQQGTGRYDHSY